MLTKGAFTLEHGRNRSLAWVSVGAGDFLTDLSEIHMTLE
jgi:hypothetical protein